MHVRQCLPIKKHRGMSLIGLIFVLAILAVIVLLASKIAPTVIEYVSIKRAVQYAKSNGNSAKEIQTAFSKQADVGYITSLAASDLIIEKSETGLEVSFFYTKKIPLVGPASLLLEYEGTTAKSGSTKKKQE
jgi:type II secretory pathway pseudopilin PulG